MTRAPLHPVLLTMLLLLFALPLPVRTVYAGPPGLSEIGGQKMLTLISRDPPGVRCNNNIQVAAELQNRYKIPFMVIPVSQAGPGAKAPAVYYGDELVAVDGGNLNGMIDATTLTDILELEGSPLQEQGGRLTEQAVKAEFDQLKQTIKTVQ